MASSLPHLQRPCCDSLAIAFPCKLAWSLARVRWHCVETFEPSRCTASGTHVAVCGLELAMHARGEERDRPTVGVVGRVHHELVIQSQRDALDQVHGVVGFENPFAAVVELTIADQDSEATGRDVVAMILRQVVDGAGETDLVVGTPPAPAGV